MPGPKSARKAVRRFYKGKGGRKAIAARSKQRTARKRSLHKSRKR